MDDGEGAGDVRPPVEAAGDAGPRGAASVVAGTAEDDAQGAPAGMAELEAFLRGRRALALTGAGISTESGIPDYRGLERIGPVRTPVTYQEFVRSERTRRRYWARSAVGWQGMSAARPNDGHRALALLEDAGLVTGVLTQNVDGLHQAAGSTNIVELHGSLSQVVCLNCGRREPRASFQARVELLNPGFADRVAALLPDGDAELPEAWVDAFDPPACRVCGGVLKADVVFFGENVPVDRVARANALLADADTLLVLGSSLAVRSGYRFVAAATAAGKPVAIVNHGPTRGDAEASVRLDGRLGAILSEVARRLVR